MSKHRNLTITVASLALLATAGLHAQSRNLELETADGPLTVPLDDNVGVRILSDGDISATATPDFTCQQGASCDDVQVSMAGSSGALVVSPGTVAQGSTFQVTWDSRGAWQCNGTGLPGTSWNNSNPKPPRGSVFVSTDDVPLDNYTLELACENGPVMDTRTVQLTVDEQSDSGPGDITLPAVCNNVAELRDFAGWTQTTDARPPFGNDEEQTFAQYFGPWPGAGASVDIGIPKDQYAALPFNTGNLNSGSTGVFNREQATTVSAPYMGPGPTIVSFSRCPGDFDPASPALESPGCVIGAPFNFSTIRWGGPGAGRACELEPNTQYFMNIVHTTSNVGVIPPVQAPDCGGKSRCGWLWNTSGSE